MRWICWQHSFKTNRRTFSLSLNILKEKSENSFIEDIKNLKNIFNYELSTILLGLNGIVLKCHGSSSYKSFTHAINEAEKMYNLRLINRINNFLKELKQNENSFNFLWTRISICWNE